MGIKRIAVCDSEAEFVKKFIKQAGSGRLGGLKFIGISREDFFEQEKDVDFWILGNGFWEKAFLSECDRKCVLLCEERLPEQFKRQVGIFKYQAAARILNELYRTAVWEEVVASETNPLIHRGKVMYVYSPTPHPENICYSMALAELLAEDAKVIYINLKGNLDFGRLFAMEDGETIGDLYCRLSRDEVQADIRSFVHSFGNMEVILPVKQCFQAAELDAGAVERITDYIQSQGIFDYIVYDMGDMSESWFKLYTLGDIRVTVTGAGTVERVAREKFEAFIEMYGHTETLKSTILKRLNGCFDDKSGEALREEVINGCYKRYVSRWFKENGGVFDDERSGDQGQP